MRINNEKYSSMNALEGQEIEENSKIIKYDIYMMIIHRIHFKVLI